MTPVRTPAIMRTAGSARHATPRRAILASVKTPTAIPPDSGRQRWPTGAAGAVEALRNRLIGAATTYTLGLPPTRAAPTMWHWATGEGPRDGSNDANMERARLDASARRAPGAALGMAAGDARQLPGRSGRRTSGGWQWRLTGTSTTDSATRLSNNVMTPAEPAPSDVDRPRREGAGDRAGRKGEKAAAMAATVEAFSRSTA